MVEPTTARARGEFASSPGKNCPAAISTDRNTGISGLVPKTLETRIRSFALSLSREARSSGRLASCQAEIDPSSASGPTVAGSGSDVLSIWPATGPANKPTSATIESHITAGFTFSRVKNREWNVALMIAPNKSVTGPQNFDPTQNVTLQMYEWEAEVSYAWRF